MTAPACFPADEAERLATLRRYSILDTPPEENFNRIVRLASRQFKVPIALISLIDENRQWFKAVRGLDAKQTDRDPAFCAHTILGDSVFYIPDATRDERFADNPFVTGDLGIRFYAGAPLVTPLGVTLGTLCLIDTEPRHDFSAEDQALLTDLAAVVVDQIEMRYATGDVLTAVEGRIKAEDDLATTEHQLELFFAHTPVAVAMFDTQMRYIAASSAWRDVFELETERLVGRCQYDVVPHLPAEWRLQNDQCLQGATWTIEEDQLPRPGGGFHWVRRRACPWRERSGKIGGVIVFVELINDRKEAEAELERSHAFFQAVLENMQDGIVACDADGRLSLFNAATRRFHGVDSAPIPPEQWTERYDLFDADGETPLAMERIPLFRALNGETVEQQEMVIAAKGQEPRRLVADAAAMFDSSGNKLGAVASMHDVTKERKAEERWKNAESRYRAIFNHTFQFCGLLDLDGTLLEANDTAINFAGLTRADLVGKPFWDCHWWQVGEPTKAQLRDAVERARTGAFVRYEVEVQGRGGLRIPIDFSLKPVEDENGAVIQLIAEGRDISDKRETEALLRLVADNLPFLVAYVDTDLRYRFINRTGAQWFARPAEDILGRTAQEILGNANLKGLKEHLLRASGGKGEPIEEAVTYCDGIRRFVQRVYVPDRDENGTIRGYIAIAMDTTERKTAEEALKRHKNELELILNSVPIRVFYKDDKNRILRLNKPAADSLGISVEAGEGADTYDLFPEMANKYHDDDLEVINSGQPKLGIVEEYTPRDGQRGWVRTDKVPHTDPDTGERFIFVAAFDITTEKHAEDALRASEERYRLLYNKTPVMLHSIDREGRLLSVSDFWLDKLGYERSEVIGRDSTDFLTPESRERATKGILPEFVRTGTCKDIECQMVTKSGQVVDVLLSAIAEHGNTGDVIKSLAVMTDITDRKVVERQFVQAQKMESVGQLTGGLAHDFNNLLGVIMGNLQLIERSVKGNEKAEKRITAALGAVDKGAELTRRLLAFSRKQNLETEAVAPGPLLTNISHLIQRTLGESVELESHVPPDLPVVRTDPNQLESAILNLAVNARDAMPDGGKLTIEANAVRINDNDTTGNSEIEAGDYVVIAVTDTGNGIPKNKLQNVFEPFFTTKEVGKGSGLGLSMIYGFMKQSGGQVRIYSEEEVGTTVRLYLPIGNQARETTVVTPEAVAQVSGGREKILVVEDQEEVRDIAVALLEDLGYVVHEAGDAAQGLRLLGSDDAFDLLFTDIVMPGGMDGTKLAQQARELRPGLPVVFTTGYAEAAVLHEGEVYSASNLVTKPYRRNELATKIRSALDASKAGAVPTSASA